MPLYANAVISSSATVALSLTTIMIRRSVVSNTNQSVLVLHIFSGLHELDNNIIIIV